MIAPTVSISANSSKESFKDTIDISADATHPEHLLEVLIHEDLRALRDRVDVDEAENASLRAMIRMMEAVKTVLRNHERQARIEIERQLASVQESYRQD
ncbi:hypothetical protein Tco_1442363 [Tanacetum coccineum]